MQCHRGRSWAVEARTRVAAALRPRRPCDVRYDLTRPLSYAGLLYHQAGHSAKKGATRRAAALQFWLVPIVGSMVSARARHARKRAALTPCRSRQLLHVGMRTYGGASWGWGDVAVLVLSGALQLVGLQFVLQSAQANSGGEYAKDAVIVGCAVQLLSLVWDGAWYLLLTVPAFALYKGSGLLGGLLGLGGSGGAASDDEQEQQGNRRARREKRPKMVRSRGR